MKPTQSIPKHLRYTIQHFNAQFPDNDSCLDWLKAERWPSGLIPCAKCGVERSITAFRPSGLRLRLLRQHDFPDGWNDLREVQHGAAHLVLCMYLMSATRCGISAKQIQRETGVTYKTAWRMFKQIRTLMSEDVSLEGEAVEMDETYMGGKRRKGSKRGRPAAHDGKKACVVGAVERGGKVIAIASSDASKKTLHGVAKEYILPDSTVYTDEWNGYNGLDKVNGYEHRRINHSAGVYVIGTTHTNTIEGFWSLVKRESAAFITQSARSICRPTLTSTALGTIGGTAVSQCSLRFWNR